MKRIRILASRQSRLDVTMTPMIDVVFLLLVFFLWTASFQAMEYVLPTELSAATASGSADISTPPQEWDFDPVVIKIVWHSDRPQWIVNDQRVDNLDQVRDALLAVARIKPDLPVILDPGEAVPFGHVIDVYDISRLSGFQQIQFVASEEI